MSDLYELLLNENLAHEVKLIIYTFLISNTLINPLVPRHSSSLASACLAFCFAVA